MTLRMEIVQRCGGCGSSVTKHVRALGPAMLATCGECGLHRLHERVVADQLPLLYAGGYAAPDADAAELEQQLANPTFAHRRRRLERHIGGARRALYEMGCGDGNFLAVLRRGGWQVGGCEMDPAAVALARARHGIEVELEGGDTGAGGWPVVAAYHVLEHVYQPAAWLERVAGMLESDGLLHLQVPNYDSLTRRLTGGDWASIVFPQHVYFYTPALLSALLQRHGFTVESVETWDPWHGPGTVAISLASRLRARRAPAPAAGVPGAGAHRAAADAGAGRSAGRRIFHRAAHTLARTEAAVGRGAVVDVIARLRSPRH